MVGLTEVFVWSTTAGMILSFGLAAFLCMRCLIYLRRTERRISGRRDLVKHIAAIAGADASMALWSYFGSILHSKTFLVRGDPQWCPLFTTVRMWLILLSALWTGSLALGTLAVLLGKPKHYNLLSHTTFGVLPVSLVMCAYNVWEPCHVEVAFDGSLDCEQSSTSVVIECIEQSAILVLVLFVLAFAVFRARGRAVTSLEEKSIRIVSRYLMAYTASYGCWIIGRWPQLNRWYGHWASWQIFVSVAWRLLILNGAFNFFALWLHTRDSIRDLHQPSLHVPILNESSVSIVKVKKVDSRHLEKTVKADLAEIQNANQRLWRELGLTYEQGVFGQTEPLTEEERADHFYSILNVSSKFQQARVT